MVQTTEARHRDHAGMRCWPLLDGPFFRSVFFQRVMHAVLMVVAYVFAQEPEQMSFVHYDDMVQDLPATTPHPSFRGSILPGRLDARPLRFQTCRPKKHQHFVVELGLSVQNHITIRRGLRKRFAQLLDHPAGRRVPSHVKVQDLPAAVLDDEEALKQLERHRQHGEEVEGHDDFPVVLEKCAPPLSRIATPPHPPQITSHRPFGDLEAQFQ